MFLPSLSVLFGEILQAVDSLPDLKYRCASDDVMFGCYVCAFVCSVEGWGRSYELVCKCSLCFIVI